MSEKLKKQFQLAQVAAELLNFEELEERLEMSAATASGCCSYCCAGASFNVYVY